MSRTGRAIDLVRDFRDHDVEACKDSWWCDRSHITDEWELVNAILDVDPRFDGEARAALDRVRALHSGGEYGSVDKHLCADSMVTAEECETIRAIDGPHADA